MATDNRSNELTAEHELRGIHVVGMTKERAWQIAINARSTTPTSHKTRTIDMAEQVAELIRAGKERKNIVARLNLTRAQFDHLRQVARKESLL